MARARRRHGPSPQRHKALLLTGPLAAAGVIAGAWGGSHLVDHRAVSATASTIAGQVAGGTPAAGSSADTIVVRVRLTAALQAQLHRQDISVELPAGASVGTLLNHLSEDYPVLAAMGPSIMVAVSGSMEPPDTVVAAGEVVDLMSPLAGG